MEASDDDLIASIAPDVLKYLARVGYFERLDDLLSPRDASRPRQECDGTYRLSESILPEFTVDNAELADILAVLSRNGACCDCEVLYNVAESSRLKAKYWQKRPEEHGASRAHHPHPQG